MRASQYSQEKQKRVYFNTLCSIIFSLVLIMGKSRLLGKTVFICLFLTAETGDDDSLWKTFLKQHFGHFHFAE